MDLNKEQQEAVDRALKGESFNLIGPAGSGKTSTLYEIAIRLEQEFKLPPLESGTKILEKGAPGIVFCSFTRRAVRNIAKRVPHHLQGHCHTIHALLEFEPEYYDDIDQETGKAVKKLRFAPTRGPYNPLPDNLKYIIIDEASMPSIDLFNFIVAAKRNYSSTCFIFVGDLNQLPPVYGLAILGKKLIELPTVELIQVYRQALESPIISLATAVRTNNFREFEKDSITIWGADKSFAPRHMKSSVELNRPGKGKVIIKPWLKQVVAEKALANVKQALMAWAGSGVYDPENDMILCPWHKPGTFGTTEINKAIADKLGKDRGATIYEVIAGFNRHYLAVGDKLMVNKLDGKITRIEKNIKYTGKAPAEPSKDLDRWGSNRYEAVNTNVMSELDIDTLLEKYANDEIDSKVNSSSHMIWVYMYDTGEEVPFSDVKDFNSMDFGYALTVHKAQGSEWRKVLFITHNCHISMMSRELVYTAITRAREELLILCTPQALSVAAQRPRIKGESLAAKIAFFQTKLDERLEQDQGQQEIKV